MNKQDMIKEIAGRIDVSNKTVSAVLETFQQVVKENVSTGNKVAISGFITFEKRHVEERSGVSQLGDGKTWTKPAHDEIKVTLSKAYKNID